MYYYTKTSLSCHTEYKKKKKKKKQRTYSLYTKNKETVFVACLQVNSVYLYV